MHHYLEGPAEVPAPDGAPSAPWENPFADDWSRKHPGRVPCLHRLNPWVVENVDTKEEIQQEFLKRLERDGVAREDNLSISGNGNKGNGNGKGRGAVGSGIGAATPNNVVQVHRQRVRENIAGKVGGERERERERGKENHQRARGSRGEEEDGEESYPTRAGRHTHSRQNSGQARSRSRSLLQHAWQVVSTTDPLLNSDEEMLDDAEHVRCEYKTFLT
ncbi:hypothetical protein FIBSPDRAFT_925080 [Athelia psychrophila]|uniref:Uncharacterized protein n=1 Tax=Athelia psychrophila TaxID=1759441 RepID=A0A166VCU0_9AGAM|nr:hypothetical protein FIBSPDRAFT_925080 [Fibularhizoctonia sp. CBS 109695]